MPVKPESEAYPKDSAPEPNSREEVMPAGMQVTPASLDERRAMGMPEDLHLTSPSSDSASSFSSPSAPPQPPGGTIPQEAHERYRTVPLPPPSQLAEPPSQGMASLQQQSLPVNLTLRHSAPPQRTVSGGVIAPIVFPEAPAAATNVASGTNKGRSHSWSYYPTSYAGSSSSGPSGEAFPYIATTPGSAGISPAAMHAAAPFLQPLQPPSRPQQLQTPSTGGMPNPLQQTSFAPLPTGETLGMPQEHALPLPTTPLAFIRRTSLPQTYLHTIPIPRPPAHATSVDPAYSPSAAYDQFRAARPSVLRSSSPPLSRWR